MICVQDRKQKKGPYQCEVIRYTYVIIFCKKALNKNLNVITDLFHFSFLANTFIPIKQITRATTEIMDK